MTREGNNVKVSFTNRKNYLARLKDYKWEWFATLTFKSNPGRKSANRRLINWSESLQAAECEPIKMACVGEYTPGDRRFHFHVLIAGLSAVNVVRAQSLWRRHAAFALIDKYDPSRHGLEHIVKSLEKKTTKQIYLQAYDHPLRIDQSVSSHALTRDIDTTADLPRRKPVPRLFEAFVRLPKRYEP